MRRYIALLVATFSICLFSLTANAATNTATNTAATAAGPFKVIEGKHYQVLPETVQFHSNRDDGKVEIQEFFSYACPHCYHLEPQLDAWLTKGKPANVAFERVPVIFYPGWEELAKGYHVSTELNVMPEMNLAIFEAIHKDHKNIMSRDAMQDLFTSHKVDKDKFLQAYNSFGVQRALEHDKVLTKDYMIQGVPAFVVNGKYLTDLSMAGNAQNEFEILEFLLAKEAKATSVKTKAN